jgi:hypothetical protein
MIALTIVETVLLVVAVVYIVALLRSHADILRRLAVLEDGHPLTAAAPGRSSASAEANQQVDTAAAITGQTPDGDAVTLSFAPGSPSTLLAFLTSGCSSCAPLWEGLRDPAQRAGLADRLVVVTHGGSRESPARLARLAPEDVEVVMASRAWEDYAVPASPHFVLTGGDGGILGRGSARSWEGLRTMVDDARTDSAAAPARSTAERALRSELTLAHSGIAAGHPSLYPSRSQPPAGGAS